MPAVLTFHSGSPPVDKSDTLLLVGRAKRLLSDEVAKLLPGSVPRQAWQDMIKRNDPGDNGRSVITHTGELPRRVAAGILPEVCSRHNTPSRAWATPRLVQSAGVKGDVSICFCLDDDAHAVAHAIGAARAHPTFSGTSRTAERTVHLGFLGPGGPIASVDRLQIIVEAVRKAAHWVDAPPNVLNVDALVEAANAVGRRNKNVSVMVLRGKQLQEQGLGGLWAVGKAANEMPAFVVLDYAPKQARKQVAWVGKGIVYDTGGLSIKTKTGMPSMKTDMAGAAAVLAAFEAAVRLGVSTKLSAALCVAENAVGPEAVRPDDIIRMFSGRTVEINNTDAEGRLVLADGVAWMHKHRDPDELIDVATLTGAQAIATGKRHAGLYCNDDEFEARAVAAGRLTGDLVHPLPYVPEFYRGEFASQVADMRNSVKDRNNAQSSCAGQFVGNHLGKYANPWLHVDMAAPSKSGGRATGYGVGLLLGLLGVVGAAA